MPNNNNNGFYGPDGEFYPSQSAASQSYAEPDEELYPKRPNINYTTTAYPAEAPQVQVMPNNPVSGYTGPTKYCKYCGQKIPEQAVICTHCGCQVEDMKHEAPPPQVIVNNAVNTYANNNNVRSDRKHEKNKWLAFFLCLFGGAIGLHKFYEGKVLAGFIYMFTGGLFGVGWFIDTIALLLKPNPYYV